MAYRNLITINEEDKDLKEFSEKERKQLADIWNRRAAETVNYREVKSAWKAQNNRERAYIHCPEQAGN